MVREWGENGHVTEVDSLMEREWSCYGGGQFKGGRMVITEVVSLNGENGPVMEVASLKKGKWLL